MKKALRICCADICRQALQLDTSFATIGSISWWRQPSAYILLKNAQTAQCRHTLTENLICEVLTSYACNLCRLRVRARRKNGSEGESHLMLLLCTLPVVCWCIFKNPHFFLKKRNLTWWTQDCRMSSLALLMCIPPCSSMLIGTKAPSWVITDWYKILWKIARPLMKCWHAVLSSPYQNSIS